VPLDVRCSIQQSSQYGAGIFLNTVGTDDTIRINNEEYLDNVWHRFGLITHVGLLNGKACARTCKDFSPGRPVTDKFLSGAHCLSCSSCGTLKRHNAIGNGPLSEHFKTLGLHYDLKHTVLGNFGKHAVDGVLHSPYTSAKKTVLDITVGCPTCPSYVKTGAAASNEYCTKILETDKHTEYDALAHSLDLDFCAAAFTTYGGWGAEFRNRYVEPHFKSALKLAKANGGNGWDVISKKQRLMRHLAAVICRENSRMLRSATRSRPAGSRPAAVPGCSLSPE
jgi:hypothetical protein